MAGSVWNCGRRHLRDGKRRKDGTSTTAEWPPPVGKKQSSLEALTPSNPGHQRSLQIVLSEEDSWEGLTWTSLTPHLHIPAPCLFLPRSNFNSCVKSRILDNYFPKFFHKHACKPPVHDSRIWCTSPTHQLSNLTLKLAYPNPLLSTDTEPNDLLSQATGLPQFPV